MTVRSASEKVSVSPKTERDLIQLRGAERPAGAGALDRVSMPRAVRRTAQPPVIGERGADVARCGAGASRAGQQIHSTVRARVAATWRRSVSVAGAHPAIVAAARVPRMAAFSKKRTFKAISRREGGRFRGVNRHHDTNANGRFPEFGAECRRHARRFVGRARARRQRVPWHAGVVPGCPYTACTWTTARGGLPTWAYHLPQVGGEGPVFWPERSLVRVPGGHFECAHFKKLSADLDGSYMFAYPNTPLERK